MNEEAPQRTALMFVGAMDEARVEGALSRFGYAIERPVDASLFPRERRDLAVIDPEAFGPDPEAAARKAGVTLTGTPLVVLSGPRSRDDLVRIITIPSVKAIVARDHVASDEELRRAVEALTRGPRFGLEDRLPPGAERFSATLAQSDDREPVLEQLRAFFARRGVRERLLALLVAAAEELITNAVYDAPADAEGRRIYAELDRRHGVILSASARPTVHAAVDGADALVSVCDPHGSLDQDVVRRFLGKGLRGGPNQIDDKRGGAGLGIARVFAMVDQMTVQVEQGVRSEVTLSLALRGARRDMAARPTGLLLVQA